MTSPLEIIYSKQVPIDIVSFSSVVSKVESISPNDKKTSLITVQVSQSSPGSRETVSNFITKMNALTTYIKCLHVQLTDELDPYFLYQLQVNADAFHILRSEQNILVDFVQFPIKFIELLEECIKSKNDEHPKFVCKLMSDAQTAIFSVIETNSFRNIIHISLSFVPGNDAAVKVYLAGLVKQFKIENGQLHSKLQSTGDALSCKIKDSTSLVDSLTHEIESLKVSKAQNQSQMELEHTKLLSQERERFSKEREESRIEAERNLRNLDQKYQDQLKAQSEKLASLTETQSNTSSKLRQLQSQYDTLEKLKDSLFIDHESCKRELEKSKFSLKEAERNNSLKDSTIEKLEYRIQSLEKQERQVTDHFRINENKLETLFEQKSKLEETIELYKTQNSRLEDNVQKSSEEINKGNDIIRRLSSELKSAKSKIKLKNTVTLQQEKLLDERGDSLLILQKEIQESKALYEKSKIENESLVNKLQDSEKKLQESKNIISDNNHVIEWLHKQLNEDALHRPLSMGGVAPTIDFTKYSTLQPLPQDKKRPSPTRLNPRFSSENRPPSNNYSVGQDKSPSQRVGTSPSQQNVTPPSFGQYKGVSHFVEGSKMSNLAPSTTHLGQSVYETSIKNTNPLKPSVGIKSNYF